MSINITTLTTEQRAILAAANLPAGQLVGDAAAQVTRANKLAAIPWRPRVSYVVGTPVVHELASYLCNEDHISLAHFDKRKWVRLGGACPSKIIYQGYQLTPGGPAVTVQPGPVFTRNDAANAEFVGGWALDPTSTEAMVVLANIPPEWRGRTIYVDAVMSAPSGSTVSASTAVAWRCDMTQMQDDDAFRGVTPSFAIGTVHAVKLRAATRVQRFRFPETFVGDPDDVQVLRINRIGADASDTFASDVRLLQVLLSVSTSTTSDHVIVENVGRSWWSEEAVVRCPDGSLISGGSALNGKGSIIAGKRKLDGTTSTFILSNLDVTGMDEHNIPAFVIHENTGQVLVGYAQHGAQQQVHLRKSTTPYEVDFGGVTDVTFSGSGVTYVRLFYMGGDTVWLFTRADDGWALSMTNDFGTTWSTPKVVIQFPGSDKGYMVGKLVNNRATIRVAMCGHPVNSLLHDICVGEINVATKEIRKLDGTVIDDIDTMVAPVDVGATFDHAYTHSGSGSARLFSVGDASNWEIAFCTWTTDGDTYGVGNDAVYRVARYVNGAWQVSGGICPAGKVMGYLNSVHYHGGMYLPPQSPGGTFFACREQLINGESIWILSQWKMGATIDDWTEYALRSTRRKIYRPVVTPVGPDGHRGISWNEAEYYYDFGKYLTRVVGQHSFDLL